VIALPPLYVLTDRALAGGRTHAQLVAALCRGGASLIQVREKRMMDRDLLAACRDAVAEARAAEARLIVNDRADVAAIAGADGVHLGDADLPVAAAREVLGPEAWIGRSTHSVEEALEAARLPVDYIALGPVFATGHAGVQRPALGLDAVSRAAAGLRVPLVAIGGITRVQAKQVLAAGAASVAVMGDLMTAPDIAAATAELLDLLRG
jgi:thiamine-phosphate pyrophosphorylase